MADKKNLYLLGVIIALLVYYSLTVNFVGLGYRLLPAAFAGVALLFLYYTKGNFWALPCGLAIWVILFRWAFPASQTFYSAIAFFLPGLVILYAYHKNKNLLYVLPGCFFIWSGIFICLSALTLLEPFCASILMLCLGMAFLCGHFISHGRLGLWTQCASILLFLLGFFMLKGIPSSVHWINTLSLLLLFTGITVLCTGLMKKNRNKR